MGLARTLLGEAASISVFDSISETSSLVVWLKVELCKLLVDKRSAELKPNDFHDIPKYFLEAIPHVVAMVRAADKKSPREAVEFVLQLLKVITFWVVIIPA
ncbi:transcription initiation factor TFIID subunit 2-like [Rosa chinensis]|uniref:transcription initiation factor TFIID subunit 2-like n=1 Tax=Rosa chinensis TaxID=74649 RepID=UPI001AD8DF48|nr:transcription initiation factor TFIID subunit 2-like [Rosa chinensis]